MTPSVIDPGAYRRVLGSFPTGVAIITAMTQAHGPVGMVVGSFTSVSLDPPLVAFLPMKASSTYARLASSPSFCVNFLAADQEDVCRIFASRAADKFAGVPWREAPSGSPILHGGTGWVDCDTHSIHEAGDHFIVVGRVRDLATERETQPLVFFRGGYGRFSTSFLVAGAEPDLFVYLRLVDVARPLLEQLATRLDLQSSVTARLGNEMVVLASAGNTADQQVSSRLGQRVPFAPPLGAVHAAWGEPGSMETWLGNLGPGAPEQVRAAHRAAAQRVRARGWSIGLNRVPHRGLASAMASAQKAGHTSDAVQALRSTVSTLAATHEPENLGMDGDLTDVGVLSAPVIGPDGRTALGVSLTGFQTDLGAAQLQAHAEELVRTCGAISHAIRPLLHAASSESARQEALS